MVVVTAEKFAVTYAAPPQRVFGTQAVPLADGLLVVGVGMVFFAVIEAEKQLRLSLRRATVV